MRSRWLLLCLAGFLLVVLADRAQGQNRGRGNGRGSGKTQNAGRGVGKAKGPSQGRKSGRASGRSRRSTSGLGGGISTGGLGSGISTGVTGQAFGRSRSHRRRPSRGIAVGSSGRGVFFIGTSRSSQRPSRSTSGLGGGIPTGGLGAGISTGVTGRANSLLAFPHARHCGSLGRTHLGRGFVGISHYSYAGVPPDVEPGYRAVYVKARWVRIDTGQIRFTGGWLSVADDVDSIEPVWIPASWYDAEDGSHVRVIGHWDFAEAP